MSSKILVIDDETSMLTVIEAILQSEEYEVVCFDKALEGIEHYKNYGADLVISDIRMKPIDGIKVLQTIRELNPNAIVILITAFANAEDALQALKIGAYDYIQKPFKMERLKSLIKRALKVHKIMSESQIIEESKVSDDVVDYHGLITRNPVMKKLFELVNKVAPSKTTILIQGESGTGKELFAKAIHNISGKDNHPFIAINCGALPEQLLESELFGHVKGSFTGAYNDKDGLFYAAGNGTIFLDEISSLSLNLQAKLLRVLQEKEIRPVGGIKTYKVNCRVIAATNERIEELINKNSFREDLYYRLSIIPVEIPPLRDRIEDIVVLVKHFIKKFDPVKVYQLGPQIMNMFYEYHWPGNVRELENAIERITTLCIDGEVKVEDLPTFIQRKSAFSNLYAGEKILPLKSFSIMAEGQYITSSLKKFSDDKRLVAKKLGVDVATINRKLDKFEKLQQTS